MDLIKPVKPNTTKRRQYFILYGLILLFVVPFVLAWITYFNHHNLALTTKNKGQLIEPPLLLSKQNLYSLNNKSFVGIQNKWLLLYVTSNNCVEDCKNNLYKMRQIRVALGKNQNQVRRILVLQDNQRKLMQWVNDNYPGTTILVQQANLAMSKQSTSSNNTKNMLYKNHLYVVDPSGYIILEYPAVSSAKNILQDIHHLLKVAHSD